MIDSSRELRVDFRALNMTASVSSADAQLLVRAMSLPTFTEDETPDLNYIIVKQFIMLFCLSFPVKRDVEKAYNHDNIKLTTHNLQK